MSIVTNFSDLDLTKQYTYADYLRWQFSERVELIKGFIVKMSPAPSKTHQVISRKLTRHLDRYFENKPCGFFVAPFDVRLLNYKKNQKDNKIYTVVQPDLCVVCDLEKLDEKGCLGAPDLVIEILSPGNSKYELGEKFKLYEENQIKEYWIVEPFENTILIYTLQNDKYIGIKPCIEGEKITSSLFPELDFEIEKIFEP
ncbi:MAG: Uma2 family endonuclease [Flavobacterium sp.]